MTKYLLIIALFCVTSVANTDDKGCANKSSETMSLYTQDVIITSFLNNAKHLLEVAKSYAFLKTSCSMPMDCAEILDSDSKAQSGIYRIWPRNRAIEGFVEVYCDMDDEGGAWTVIQRRGDFDSGSNYFFKKWDDYKRGFGDLNKDFWLGNDKIHAVTSQRLNTVKFVLSDFEGNTTYATYDDFWIEDEFRNYTMHVSGYRGTAGDSFSHHNGAQFSTRDRDNERFHGDCAAKYNTAWWFNGCYYSHLNGLYIQAPGKADYAQGLTWYHFRGYTYSLKDTVIKIKPRDYKEKVLDVTPH